MEKISDLPDTVFLTFDIDWAEDYIIANIIKRLKQYNAQATFFITHDSSMIKELQTDPQFEIGVHPKYGVGVNDNEHWDLVSSLSFLLEIEPKAVSVRSHTLIGGTPFSKTFADLGLKIDSNYYVPFNSVEFLKPWRFWTGVLNIPFVWSDYIDFIQDGRWDIKALLNKKNVLKVIAFHPIHIYLNTNSLDYYQQFKVSGLSAKQFINANPSSMLGVGNIFELYLEEISKRGMKTAKLCTLLEEK